MRLYFKDVGWKLDAEQRRDDVQRRGDVQRRSDEQRRGDEQRRSYENKLLLDAPFGVASATDEPQKVEQKTN